MGHIKLNSTSSSLVLDVDGDAVLLRALFQRWPEGKFDEASISGNARHSPELFQALRPLGAKYVRGNYLSQGSLRRLRDWFDRVEDHPIAGLVLTRDAIGWCSVTTVDGTR